MKAFDDFSPMERELLDRLERVQTDKRRLHAHIQNWITCINRGGNELNGNLPESIDHARESMRDYIREDLQMPNGM